MESAVSRVSERKDHDRPPATADALADLLVSIRHGERAAMTRFYDATAPRAFSIARAILGQAEDAEEAVLDAYMQIWRTADSYSSSRGSPIGWLTTIVRSRALDRLRRRAARPEQEVSTLPEPACESLEARPDRLMDLLTEGTSLHEAMGGLSQVQRHVIALSYLRDFTHAEIAERLGLPIGTIKSHSHRAIKALRIAIDAQAGGEA